ncbi:hypothetical protein [uncultured Sphingomonas sp.]|uniref:hypothetical protein n=1 Tax=uncultured Sphingomonas sp. TaxID=158754 RepID=UPI0025F6B989|nr:hypothetical protein [uncultured Sphingomonas sp.]
MTSDIDPTPSLGHRVAILCLVAVVGVTVNVVLWQLGPILANPHIGLPAHWPPLSFFVLCIVVGSFLAIPMCLAVGLPLWRLAQRWQRHSLADALAFGLVAGAIIGIVMALPELAGEAPWSAIDRSDLFMLAGYCVAGMCGGGLAHRLGYPQT